MSPGLLLEGSEKVMDLFRVLDLKEKLLVALDLRKWFGGNGEGGGL